MEAFDDDLDRYYETLDEVGECRLCGGCVKENKEYCSESCYRGDMS